jgi:hypothetical protein
MILRGNLAGGWVVLNTGRPVASSNANIAKLCTSIMAEGAAPSIASGSEWMSVIAAIEVDGALDPNNLAPPKSVVFGIPLFSRMFCGFRSKGTTHCE